MAEKKIIKKSRNSGDLFFILMILLIGAFMFIPKSFAETSLEKSELPEWVLCSYHNLSEYYDELASNALKDFPNATISDWCKCEDINCTYAYKQLYGTYEREIKFEYELKILMSKKGSYDILPKSFSSLNKVVAILNKLKNDTLIKDIAQYESDSARFDLVYRSQQTKPSFSYFDDKYYYLIFYGYEDGNFLFHDNFLYCIPLEITDEGFKRINLAKNNLIAMFYLSLNKNFTVCQNHLNKEVSFHPRDNPKKGLILYFKEGKISNLEYGEIKYGNPKYYLMAVIIVSTLFFIVIFLTWRFIHGRK